MSTQKVLEGRLRPIYEYREVAVLLPTAAASIFVGPYLGMPLEIGCAYGATLTYWCIKRFKQGMAVRKYQKGLNVIEPFWMTTSTIPHNSKQTWIGRGFEWTDIHSQRVWDANKRSYKKYYELPPAFHKARANETAVANAEGQGLNPYRLEARKARFTKKMKHTPLDVFALYSPAGLQPAVEKFSATAVAKMLTKISWRNEIAPLPPVGGDSVTHGVGVWEETDQYISLDDRNGHSIVFGASRTGKSRFLEFLVSQDIARNDGPVVLTDPKGDAELLARMWAECKRTGREDNFFVFTLGFPEISARYNAVAQFSRLTSVAGRIAGQMGGSGDSQVFKDFAWRFLLICANAMVAVGEKPTFALLKRYVEDLEIIYLKYTEKFMDDYIDDWREAVHRIKNPPDRELRDGTFSPQRMQIPPHFKGRSTEMVARDILIGQFLLDNPDKMNVTIEGLRSALKNEQNYYNKITASLIPLLTKLTSGDIAELISPNYGDLLDERPIISWQQIIQSNGVVAILLDAMSDDEVATAVGKMIFQDLLSASGEIYKHGNEKGQHEADRTKIKAMWLHIDEFHAVAKGGGGGEPFLSLLNRSAGSGTRLTCYSQTLSDIQDAVGSAEAAGVILGNFNNTFMLRVKTEDTAEYLTQAITKSSLLGIDTSTAVSSEGTQIVDDDSDESKSADGKANWFNTRTTYGVKEEAYEPIIAPQTIMNLPKGQAFALINAQKLLKLRFPLLREVDGFVPPTMDAMLKDMKEKYERLDDGDGFE